MSSVQLAHPMHGAVLLKTITRRLTPAELAEYQPLLHNAKKLRALLSELQDLTLEIIEAGSPRQQSPEPELNPPENVS